MSLETSLEFDVIPSDVNEKITKGKLVGNLLIIAGILIYTM